VKSGPVFGLAPPLTLGKIMNEAYADAVEQKRAMYGAQIGVQRLDHNPTVEDNIDEKIRYYEAELVRLKQSKEDLAPLLKMRIRDIRQAMEY
jgi:hypothetical protein